MGMKGNLRRGAFRSYVALNAADMAGQMPLFPPSSQPKSKMFEQHTSDCQISTNVVTLYYNNLQMLLVLSEASSLSTGVQRAKEPRVCS
jgi:hypothetical protein